MSKKRIFIYLIICIIVGMAAQIVANFLEIDSTIFVMAIPVMLLLGLFGSEFTKKDKK